MVWLKEHLSANIHTHTHINTQPGTQTQPPRREAQVVSTKNKNTSNTNQMNQFKCISALLFINWLCLNSS